MKTKLTKKEISELNFNYINACNDYVQAFVKKQGYEFTEWVANDVGGIAVFIEQYFLNLSDIIYDIEHNCRKGLIFEWQDFNTDRAMKKKSWFTRWKSSVSYVNYNSYFMGFRG